MWTSKIIMQLTHHSCDLKAIFIISLAQSVIIKSFSLVISMHTIDFILDQVFFFVSIYLSDHLWCAYIRLKEATFFVIRPL